MPAAVTLPQSSTSPGVTPLLVVPTAKRIDVPSGRPVAVQENGARPPVRTDTSCPNGWPTDTSWNVPKRGAMVGGTAGAPTTLMAIVFVTDAWLVRSVTVTFTEYRPAAAETVPAIDPLVESSTRPDGSPLA